MPESIDPQITRPRVSTGAEPHESGETVRRPDSRGATRPARPFSRDARGSRYLLRDEVARGGMGTVYRALDTQFEREVAVKVMHPGQDAGRFVVESKITAQLPHPAIPPVYSLGKLPDGRPCLALKLIKGRTLADELKVVPRADLPHLLGAFERICEAVGFAHSRGIVHRDLKPANVMVGGYGEVYVMDWGLAKELREGGGDVDGTFVASRAAEETVAGQVKGTPAYMAPEQARGEPVNARADVFALGGILAAVLTGKAPFGGATVLETVLQAAQAELDTCFARLDACEADAELIALTKSCLSPEATERPVDGAAVAANVAAYRSGVEERLRRAEAERAAAEARGFEQAKRRRVQAALAVAVLLLVCGGTGFTVWRHEQRTERRLADESAATEQHRLHDERRAAEARAEQEAGFKATQARQGIDTSVAQAAAFRTQYRFKDAEAALAQALELARGGAPERVAAVQQARCDLDLVVKLDDVRFCKWVWTPVRIDGITRYDLAANPLYHPVFVAAGLDLNALDPAEAASRITASSARQEIVAALDDWALHAPATLMPGAPEQVPESRLLEVARRADPNSWAAQLRDPAVRRDAAAVARLAAVAESAGAEPGAIRVLAQLVAAHQGDPRPLLAAARARNPSDFECAFLLALRSDPAGTADPLGPLEAARAIRPDHVYTLQSLGAAQLARGDCQSAVPTFRELVRLTPRVATAHFNLGAALHGRGECTEAKAALQTALALDPEFGSALHALGNVLADLGDVEGAMGAYQKAIKIAPLLVPAHDSLAWLLATGPDHVRDGLRAVRLATKACETTQWMNHQYLDTLAAGYAEVGDFEKAADFQRRALTLMNKGEPRVELEARFRLYTQQKPYRDPQFAPLEVAPPPRAVFRNRE